MNKGKIFRIIKGNGLKPENFDTMDDDGMIYVIEDGIKYKLDGFNKTIVNEKKSKVFTISADKFDEEKAKEIMRNYKDEISIDDFKLNDIDIRDGIVFVNNTSTNLSLDEYTKQYEIWKPIAGENKGKITLADNELKKIKAIKKPRGWHFKDEFEDSEGNIYQKGKLVYVKKYDLKL